MGGSVLLAGLKSCEIVLLHLKAILMLVCLLVSFLTCGDEYMKVVHFVPLFEATGVGDLGWDMLHCILSLNWISRVGGMLLLLCAMCTVCCHSSYCCSLLSGRESILLMRNR